MKELDLTNATVLKWLLKKGGDYNSSDIKQCQDICTLLRMTLLSLVRGFNEVVVLSVMVCFLVAVFCSGIYIFIVMFSFLTLYLPNGWQFVDPDLMGAGIGLLGLVCLATIVVAVTKTVKGKMKFAPEYMKRSLRKLFKRKEQHVEGGKVTPSQTWVAIKEMYKSFKEKTCFRVKL